MKVTSTYIPGLKIVQSKIYRDNRGLLKEIFKQKREKNLKNFKRKQKKKLEKP